MSIDAKVRAIIESRKNNFYDLLDEFKEEGLCFPNSMEPDFAFEAGSDEERIYNTKLARFKALSVRLESNAGLYYTDDESSAFFGCSYDEILGMANDGVSIPDEVLNWAYAMAESNPAETNEPVENSDDAQTLFNTLKQNPSLNIKTITKIFVNKCVEQSDELESYLDELAPIEKELESARVEAETEKNDSLNKIKDLTKEWNELKEKLQRGDTLSDDENNRFEELRVLLGEEDKNYQKTIDNTTKNFLKIGERMTFINQKADTTYDFGTQTIEAARELAEYEKTHSTGGTLLGGLIGSDTTNVFGANGIINYKRFSETAHTVGLNTQYFSEDVNSVVEEVNILMQATADVAGFDINDPSRTVKSLTEDESLNGPAPTTPDGEETTVETEETEDSEESEQTEEEQMADGEKTLEDIDVQKLGLVELERTIKAEGKDSETKGQDATKLVERLKTQSATVDKKEEEVKQKTVEANEASETEPTEDGNDNDKVEEAQTNVETSQQELDAATEDEALTVDGLRETFKDYDQANQKYTKDVKFANKTMFTSILTGEATIVGGSTLTSMGIANISIGTSLLATAWMNPSALIIGAYLIELGSNETAVGTALIASGTALTLLACEGLEINDEATQKIDKSNVDIIKSNKDLDKIEREQMEGVDGETQDDEEENEEENIPMNERDKERALLAEMGEGNDILPPLRSQSLSDGKASSALGSENVQQSTILEKRTPELIETTITFKQTQQLVEEAPEADETEMNEVQDPAEIYDEYREDYKADLETNNEYKAEIEDTDKAAKSNLQLAGEGSLTGAARTGVGLEEIAVGTALIAQWWNPVAVALGMKLIQLGTEDVALGSELLAVGLALTVNSTTTLAADEIANLQIEESDQKANESIDRANRLEAEINAAVEKQLAATNKQDMSGMSVTELLTLIISNGISSSLTAAENTQLTEELKERLPELLERAQASADAQAETEEVTEGEGEEDKENIFTQYKTDFNADLAANEQYTAEIAQARNMSSVLNGSFFFGAPLEKAGDRINASNEETTNDLEQVEAMEKQVQKAENAETEADGTEAGQGSEEEEVDGLEDTAYDAEGAHVPEYNRVKVRFGKVVDCEEGEADITQDKDAEDEADDFEKDETKLDKKVKKEEKKVKKVQKEQKSIEKDKEKLSKASEKQTQEVTESKQNAEEANQEAEATQAESPTDEAQDAATEAENKQNEADTLSAETDELVNEMQGIADTTRSEAQAAQAENQGIFGEMSALTLTLQQDQTKLGSIGNQIKQEEQKGGSSEPEPPAPAAPAPQPAAAPKKAPAPKAPEPEEPEDKEPEEDKPAPNSQPQKAPAQTPPSNEPPEGFDKIDYASDKEKQPSFIGFVAQSDSLASGSVLASSQQKQPTPQDTNSQGGGAGVLSLKNAQNKKKTQKKKQEKKAQATGGAAGQQNEQQIIAANRTTQKPFDMNSMSGGGGADKSKSLRQSAQSIKASAFNKQARLSAMAVRANNNVMARIAEEARVQAEAARKQRLAQEKQERIDKIKEYAGYVQAVGSAVSLLGFATTTIAKAVIAHGTKTTATGVEEEVTGAEEVTTGTTETTTGATEVTVGTAEEVTGTAEEVTGTTEITTGTAAIATGTATETVGTVTAATGASLAAGVVTSPASPPPIAAGAVTIASGIATQGTGAAMEVSGGILEGTGIAEQATGAVDIGEGTAEIAEGTTEIAEGTADIAEGTADIAEGTEETAKGINWVSVGSTMQEIGNYTSTAGSTLSAGADIVNGNVLGGIASIAGSATSVIGCAAPVSQLGQAAIQLGSQGVAIAGQLTASNAGQDNGGQQQNQKKKKTFKQNARTEGIIAKTAQNKQAVGNRFSK